MTRYRDQDDDEDEWDTGETDDGGDLEDPGDEPTVPCPYCRREILEDVPQCPYCERYISEEDHPGHRQPVWIIATAVICLGMAIWWAISAWRG
jgi:hypothetical protein